MTKLKKLSILLIPICIIVGSLTTVFSISKKSKLSKKIITDQVPNTQNSQDIYKDVKIFPEIDTNNFYSYLRMNEESSSPIINDDMVLFIAKYIIKNMNVTSGEISWGFKRKSDSKVDIQIKWKHNYNQKEYIYSRTYSFSTLNYI